MRALSLGLGWIVATIVACRAGTAPGSAVVTAMLRCAKADTSGRSWAENTARTEVLAVEDGRWRIVAVHESTKPGDELK